MPDGLNGLAPLAAPTRTCSLCGAQHDSDEPHDRESEQYQRWFHSQHGRYPTWADAMAHCPQAVAASWTAELASEGIQVDRIESGVAA